MIYLLKNIVPDSIIELQFEKSSVIMHCANEGYD